MLTLPAGQACAGNTTSFIPGNNVISNGSNGPPPFNLTIPAGQTSRHRGRRADRQSAVRAVPHAAEHSVREAGGQAHPLSVKP
jgi:hypothetical protein